MKDILVVDDNMASLAQIEEYLSGSYGVMLAKSGRQALRICERARPSLIILDIDMPEMNGFEVIARIQANPRLNRIPVIFLTASRDPAVQVEALEAGARDFISKPVAKSILLHRVALHLGVASYQSQLENTVAEMTDGIAVSFSELIECRDENTGGHVVRTSRYFDLIGRELLKRNVFTNELSGGGLAMMVRAAPLHDIGKIAIPDRILLKPGRLDADEFEEIKTHTTTGVDILRNMYEKMPTQGYLQFAIQIAGTHHERYDGRGYPLGLIGDEIPASGRIMALADVYDALVDNRVYRRGMNFAAARRIILESPGQFDPVIIEVFNECGDKFEELAKSVN